MNWQWLVISLLLLTASILTRRRTMAQGWECPRCGDVYGPSVTKCTNPDCKKKPRAKPAPAFDEDGGDEGHLDTDLGGISGDDFHDMLYRETVVFPSGKPRGRRGGGRGGGGGHGSSDGSSGVF